MKYIATILTGLLFVGLLSFLLTPFLSDLSVSSRHLEPGPDGETELFKFMLFIQWPTYFLIGAISGYIFHIKFITKD